jgi:pyridoxamine 5'-phosphate oxidase
MFDEKGFVFFTNYSSQKSQQIGENPNVSLLFPWTELERQIEINGTATKISTAESLKYFLSRPRGSQLGAWASAQSSPINSRQILEGQLQKMKSKFTKGEIPLPDFWGGYRVVPETIEFWQGGEDRLHDRFEYTRKNNDWVSKRLQP